MHMSAQGAALDNRIEDAIIEANEAIALFRELGDKRSEIEVLRSMSQWYLTSDTPPKAFKVAQEALKLCQDSHLDARYEAKMVTALVEAFVANDLPAQAALAAQDGLERFRAAGDTRAEIVAWEGLISALLKQEKHEEALQEAEKALDCIRDLGDKWLEIKVLITVGQTHIGANHNDDALGPLLEAGAMARELEDAALEALSLRVLGNAYVNMEQYSEALRVASESRGLYRTCDDREGEAETLMVAFDAEISQNFRKAVDALIEAAEIFQESGNNKRTAETFQRVASLYMKRGNLGRAFQMAKYTLQIWQDMGHKKQEAEVMHLMAQILLSKSQPRAAQRVVEEMLPVCKASHSRESEATRVILLVQVELAIAIEATGDTGELPAREKMSDAMHAANEAIAMTQPMGDNLHLASALKARAQVYLWMGDPDSGVGDAEKARQIFRSRSLKAEEGTAMCLCANLYFMGYDEQKARECADQALTLSRECDDKQGEAAALAVLQRIDAAQKAAAPTVAQPVIQQVVADVPSAQAVVTAKPKTLEPAFIQSKVMKVVADVMIDEEVELDTVLMETGLDSLSSLDFVSQISTQFKEFKLGLQPALMFDFPSVRAICDHIFEEAAARMN